ncbi:DHH family phosphoesterase [Halalkalibacterium halodurans]|uniref:DHH family phosphoesterase n=1 Tax=Halalkalibacterium halodurans TaxID=86665 RepID=UPI002E247A5D|nr:DHH family phosphoesterase [Halalkalibacterium halodurans]MED4084872.1 DHH family phosphoesterase [Halalkalibacterium halodurans]MED4103464.1 DHH family phosphoesterase [Halalkalibacterium halodurans]MED4107760.1 DHH family phosphoesterase [Halalkalibacterium halodurans]MED4123800.1 DHH family phosphoesterase [Halalkalibacterium halodurans]
MPKFLLKRWHGYHVIALLAVALVFLIALSFYQWQLGVIGVLLLLVIAIFSLRARISFERDLEQYISTLSYRVHKAGEEAVTQLPVGMILYNDQLRVQWVNPYAAEHLPKAEIDASLEELSPELVRALEEGTDEQKIVIEEKTYDCTFKPNERLIYFFDITESERMHQQFEESQPVLTFIYLDNYDEVTQGMEDQVRSRLMSQVTSSLNQWANEHDLFLRRTAADRFIAVMSYGSLLAIEKTKFGILDEIRETTGKEKIPLTLSIGVGYGDLSLRELGQLAQSSLDLALGRGGDQVAIKQKTGKVRFYGGKSNAMEKRTRVRARVISHALRDFVLESDRVIVMGHKNPDMDAVGAAIGILKIAEVNDREAFVVLDPNDVNPDVSKLMEEVEKNEQLWDKFITPEESLELMTEETLLVVVDTHKPSMVIEPRLLNYVERVVVLDHHRRGEEFIEDPVLVYMEPYASSAAELVTELLEYQPKKLKMDILESTALLAGMIVDTKSFAIRTGARTFDAASFLRSHGADTVLVQKLLKEDLNHYVKRAKLVETAKLYRDGMAIATAREEEAVSQLLIAQAADTLLTMKGVVASFVISRRHDGIVSISARSLGDVNVQLIMESLDGGGHLTNAATQFEDATLKEAEAKLKEAIDQYLEGGS